MMVGYRLGIDWRKVESTANQEQIKSETKPKNHPIITAKEDGRVIEGGGSRKQKCDLKNAIIEPRDF